MAFSGKERAVQKKGAMSWLNSDKELITYQLLIVGFQGAYGQIPSDFLLEIRRDFCFILWIMDMQKTWISCVYTMDNCCVELKFTDGSMIAIDTIAVENWIAENMYQRSELDYLIYNDPIGYADLILYGDPEIYLKP